LERTNIQYVPAEDRKVWHNPLHVSLKHNRPKGKEINNDVFTLYLTEIQNRLADTWRISPEIVQEFGQIENFQASHHSMWLQEKRDPTKEWLQLSYCVMMQDIQMEVKEWPEEWKVPMIPKTMPTVQTQMQGRTVPMQQTDKNGASKKKKMTQGPVGTSIPIQKKSRTQKKSQHGSTRNPPHVARHQGKQQSRCAQKK
jgi:hypothetical protein